MKIIIELFGNEGVQNLYVINAHEALKDTKCLIHMVINSEFIEWFKE